MHDNSIHLEPWGGKKIHIGKILLDLYTPTPIPLNALNYKTMMPLILCKVKPMEQGYAKIKARKMKAQRSLSSSQASP
jgi:hypothetical protein